MHAVQIELLEKSKRRVVATLCVAAVVLLTLSALRFVPRLNDALAGKPEYVRVLTEAFARQLGTQTQMQFPVIVEQDESTPCQAVNAPSFSDEELRGTIYLLTYSERRHLTCMTTYIVPTDASRFSGLRSFTPSEGRNYGPAFLRTIKAIAQDRIAHVYAPEYLKRLHWRYEPHFPLSPSEAASLRSQSYYSDAKQPGGSVSIDLDYGELRAEVAERRGKVNVALACLLAGCTLLCLFLVRRLYLFYQASSQCCRLYESKLTPRTFLRENVTTKLSNARRQYFERQQQAQVRQREAEKLQTLRETWLEALRSTLPNLGDEQVRRRIQNCLQREPNDLEQMKSLWVEVQEKMGLKTPADKLGSLLESAKPYCTDEEFLAGRAEAFAILNKSGFRAARTFAINMHDQYKTRAREMEELEDLRRTSA